MISKAGLGLIGLGTIGVGGIALANPSWLGIWGPMPAFHNLSEDNDFETKYKNDNNKFGNKYRNYLVGVTSKKGESDETNQDWWEWAYRRLDSRKNNQGKFNSVTKGYGTEDNHLSKVCKETYDTNDNNWPKDNENKFKKWEAWKYCSIGGSKPRTIKEFNDNKPDSEEKEEYKGNNIIGSGTDSESKLLSIKNKSNKWIWDIKNQEFFSNSNTISAEGYFKIEKEKTGDNRRHIQQICEDAYKKEEKKDGSGVDKITKEETKKYCSSDPITTSLR